MKSDLRLHAVSAIGLAVAIFLAFGSTDTGNSGSITSSGSSEFKPPDSGDVPSISENEDLKWQYDESPDEMGRGKIRSATISSINEVDFDFPYQGSQRARLVLRRHPKYGRDVILMMERGQFLTGIDGCNVSVRFDGGKPRTYRGMGAADGSTTHLFLNGFDRFLSAAKKAKKVYIEAPFYQEGERVFEFNIAGLKF